MGIIILSRASWTVNIASKHDTDQMPTFSGALQCSPKTLERTEVLLGFGGHRSFLCKLEWSLTTV